MAAVMSDNSAEPFENYLITSAKNSLKHGISEAKSWLLMAKVLFPHKFGVQFLAYQIAKNTDNIKDAAASFTELLTSFPNEPELCFEIQALTQALRQFEETQQPLESADFLVKLFHQLPPNVQRSLLLSCASKTANELEHCKLMLLVLRKFINDIPSLGPEVMETLINAENRQKPASCQNNYRKLLVCDLLPLLANWSTMELSTQSSMTLLDKAIEFYMSCAFEPNRRSRRDDHEGVFVDDPWTRLWDVLLLLGRKQQWELCQVFTRYWTREAYFKSLQTFLNRTDRASQQQIAVCTSIVLLRCIHEYLPIVEPANPDTGYVLVEAFAVPEGPQMPGMSLVTKKGEDETSVLVTVGTGAPNQLLASFLAGIRCLDILHQMEYIHLEYKSLMKSWKVDKWLQTFLLDATMYRPIYDRTVIQALRGELRKGAVVPELVRLALCYQASDVIQVVEIITKIAGLLSMIPQTGANNISQLTVKTHLRRHVHFLPITKATVLQYCVKILLTILKGRNHDLALGHSLVLMQLNWPAECELLDEITDVIIRNGSFTYLFTTYVINIDILERFAFLAGPNGPKIALDVFNNQPVQSSRRMSTRGIDKGAKEDFRTAIRAQIARWNEPVDELIIRFLKTEYELIARSLMG